MARTVVLIGTGTSVGKTYVAERLLRAAGALGRTASAYKPVESGVSGLPGSDIERLRDASTFHVKPPLASTTFAAPVSAHLAARLEGRTLDLGAIREEIRRGQECGADLFLVELPGGAFSPLTDEVSGAEFTRSLTSARTVLVAPDRLGVLHDISATTRACAAMGLPLYGIVLNAPLSPDASTGTNLAALPLLTRVPVLGGLPTLRPDAPVAVDDPARALVARLLAE